MPTGDPTGYPLPPKPAPQPCAIEPALEELTITEAEGTPPEEDEEGETA